MLMQIQNLTMSSREIADLLNSRHDSVKRTMERLSAKGVIQLTPSVEVNHLMQNVSVYLVGKDDSYVTVAQLCPEFTKKLVERWQELEKNSVKCSLPDFSNPAEAARAWAKEFEEKQFAQLELQKAQPKISFVDRYVEADGTKSLREAAKALEIPEKQMIKMLVENNVLFRQSGVLLPKSRHHQDYKRFKVKEGESNGHAYQQTRVTAEGMLWLSKKFKDVYEQQKH